MHEVVGDIWAYAESSIIAITTNGSLTKSGKAVLGRGVARQALQHYAGIDENLGGLIREHGNHVMYLGESLVSFPVEETAWSQPDLRIISRSASELRKLADASGWSRIAVPRPGCGGGGLAWKDVRPLLVPWFDARFTVIGLPTVTGGETI